VQVTPQTIRALQEQVREVHASPANQARSRYWQVIPHERWEPAFIRTLPQPRRGGPIPFVVEPALAMWAAILGFDQKAYYSDPLVYLSAQLGMKVYHAQHFADDTYIDQSFRLMFATLLEGSMVGVPYGFTERGHPWLDYQHPPLGGREDLQRLAPPDFFSSGIMPLVHRFYAQMRGALDDDFLVKFPDWIMGPFGVGCELRGFDRFLMDLLSDPEFARDVLRAIVEARMAWQQQCDAFLGIPRRRGLLGNDDVNCPTLSPALYRDVLLPLELELCAHYGGIFYWHSCGNTTRLLPDIARIPVLDLFHCGPWTDVAKACTIWGQRGVPLEICPDPVETVQMATPEQQERYLRELKEQIPDDVACYVRIDSLEIIRDLPTELAAIHSWIDCARRVLGS